MMGSCSILFCAQMILFHVTLIKGTNQVTERLEQSFSVSNIPFQEFGDEEADLRNFKRIKIPFHIELSSLYHKVLKNPNSHSFRTMNNYTQVILNATNLMIGKLQKEYQEREIPLSIYKTVFDRFSGLRLNLTRKNSLKINLPTKTGTPKTTDEDSSLKLKIKSWMTRLIRDKDIMLASRINEEIVFKALSKLGTNVGNWKSVFYHKLYEEQEFVDVGLIRYPDFENPFFVFYQLRLSVYRTSKKILMVYQVDNNGIRGSITVNRYVPNEKTKEMLHLNRLKNVEAKRAEEILT